MFHNFEPSFLRNKGKRSSQIPEDISIIMNHQQLNLATLQIVVFDIWIVKVCYPDSQSVIYLWIKVSILVFPRPHYSWTSCLSRDLPGGYLSGRLINEYMNMGISNNIINISNIIINYYLYLKYTNKILNFLLLRNGWQKV